eukprot:CAMPEP_0118851284 /NCGR_PEP_ID=MMETSP1163-20130328/785_1 /TAXON_ID=124430 /ORGANISM="Phaeomonas parva, Strain CCMP2877" /LENGTH=707 /DNA_ID=CAMNT_0006783595 /DNA_START=262 /DNA_END=2385 /DNA_ORIENTATION=-
MIARGVLLLALVAPATAFMAPASRARRAATPLRMAISDEGPYVGPATKPLLDSVKSPTDMKSMTTKELKQLAHELRWEVLESVSKTGGHLGSALGVVELTVALHAVFNAPEDKICWDVSHQVYPHKILTGRRERMDTLRQYGGISGFAKMKESEYDAFGAGHSSTSISAALGMSEGKRQMRKKQNQCIAVIGDGAITGGMAYEAMNSAGYLNSRMLVILNDNAQVSLPTGTPSVGGTVPSGALSAATSRMLASKPFQDVRDVAKTLNRLMPDRVQEINKKIDEYARGIVSGGTLFEELGFYYIGPVDGHDMDNLVPILQDIRDNDMQKPILLHLKTEKGFGYPPAERASDKYHGVPKFDVPTGKQFKSKSRTPSYTSVFANALIEEAADDRTVMGITAAMPGGTGMDIFGRRFPQRTYDVGIAEQHAVTFAAGMAVEGLKPFCCIYSTFLQRGYDQVMHDCVLQHLPVRLVLDRAGLVGNDGPTHHGSFDLAYLGALPEIVIMAPSDEVELMNMVATQVKIDDKTSAMRYPRGTGYGLETLNSLFGYGLEEMPKRGEVLPIGKGRIVKQGSKQGREKVALLTLGTRLSSALIAAKELEEEGMSVTVADARFMKPLDIDLVRKLASENDVLVTVEEGSIGGFGDHVLHFLSLEGALDDGKLKMRPMVLPDRYIEAGTQQEQYDEAGLNSQHIAGTVRKLLKKSNVPVL